MFSTFADVPQSGSYWAYGYSLPTVGHYDQSNFSYFNNQAFATPNGTPISQFNDFNSFCTYQSPNKDDETVKNSKTKTIIKITDPDSGQDLTEIIYNLYKDRESETDSNEESQEQKEVSNDFSSETSHTIVPAVDGTAVRNRSTDSKSSDDGALPKFHVEPILNKKDNENVSVNVVQPQPQNQKVPEVTFVLNKNSQIVEIRSDPDVKIEEVRNKDLRTEMIDESSLELSWESRAKTSTVQSNDLSYDEISNTSLIINEEGNPSNTDDSQLITCETKTSSWAESIPEPASKPNLNKPITADFQCLPKHCTWGQNHSKLAHPLPTTPDDSQIKPITEVPPFTSESSSHEQSPSSASAPLITKAKPEQFKPVSPDVELKSKKVVDDEGFEFVKPRKSRNEQSVSLRRGGVSSLPRGRGVKQFSNSKPVGGNRGGRFSDGYRGRVAGRQSVNTSLLNGHLSDSCNQENGSQLVTKWADEVESIHTNSDMVEPPPHTVYQSVEELKESLGSASYSKVLKFCKKPPPVMSSVDVDSLHSCSPTFDRAGSRPSWAKISPEHRRSVLSPTQRRSISPSRRLSKKHESFSRNRPLANRNNSPIRNYYSPERKTRPVQNSPFAFENFSRSSGHGKRTAVVNPLKHE